MSVMLPFLLSIILLNIIELINNYYFIMLSVILIGLVILLSKPIKTNATEQGVDLSSLYSNDSSFTSPSGNNPRGNNPSLFTRILNYLKSLVNKK